MKKTDDKERKLTKAEQKRQEKFNIVRDSFIEQGYEMKEHTLGIVYANLMAIIIAVPFMIPAILLFAFLADGSFSFMMSPTQLVLFIVCNVLLIVFHEAVHGITWACFAKSHFKSISFGIMAEMCTPYCTCSEPLKKRQYITGCLMPLFVVGYIPSIIAALTSQYWLLLVGLIMIMGAGGDIIITFRMLRYKTDKNEVVVYDHPTKCGFITFER